MRVSGPRTAQADIPARQDASRDPGQRKRPHPSSTQPLSLRDDDASHWFMVRLRRMILVVEPMLLHCLRMLSISDTIAMRKALRQFQDLFLLRFLISHVVR